MKQEADVNEFWKLSTFIIDFYPFVSLCISLLKITVTNFVFMVFISVRWLLNLKNITTDAPHYNIKVL